MRWMQVLLLLVVAVSAQAAERPSAETPEELRHRILLWPGGTGPGSEGAPAQPTIVDHSDDPAVPDRSIRGIRAPYMVVYRPAHPNGSALLVVPGGGYAHIVIDNEGTSLVPAFADRAGITLFALRYRLPDEGHADGRDAPLADAQRALRLIRAHAKEDGLDPARVGVMGFSAGGHVAASLSTRFDDAVYAPVDAADRLSARPDFALLIYPVIDMGNAIGHTGSRKRLLGPHPDAQLVHDYSMQNRVSARTPPTFLLAAQDDDVVPVQNTLVYEQALLGAGVSSELHIFPKGGHGFGVRRIQGLPLAAWPRLAVDWMAWQTAQAPPR